MNHSLGFCHVIMWTLFQIDTRYVSMQEMFLRVKHAWTCLLCVLATWDFHGTVAKGKEESLEPSQQTGFQQPGFWITMVGLRIPLAGFRIPKTWIPDSTDQNYSDSGFRITLHGAKPFWSIQTQLICCIEDFKVFAGNWALVLCEGNQSLSRKIEDGSRASFAGLNTYPE